METLQEMKDSIAKMQRELKEAEDKCRKAAEAALKAKKDACKIIPRYTITKRERETTASYPDVDDAQHSYFDYYHVGEVHYRLQYSVVNAEEAAEAGHDIEGGGISISYNELTGLIDTIGGGTTHIRFRDPVVYLALVDFLRMNPEGGDITHVYLLNKKHVDAYEDNWRTRPNKKW